MNTKEEKLGTYGLEGIKGFPAEPPEVDLEFDIWLGVLNPTSWGLNLSCNIRIHS